MMVRRSAAEVTIAVTDNKRATIAADRQQINDEQERLAIALASLCK